MDRFTYRSEVEFRRLLDRLPAAAYTCDPDGLITYYNKCATDVWGRAPKLYCAEDRYCGSFKLHDLDGHPLQHDECWMALAIRHKREYNGCEIVVERPDGSRLTAMAHANPIIDAEGAMYGAVNVLVDVTDQKRTEESLREANRYKDEFIAMLAHELRNPLAPIRNALEVLKRHVSVSDESAQVFGIVERQMRQMARLVDDLMDVSRITRNHLELRKSVVQLSDVVALAVETSMSVTEAGDRLFAQRLPAEPIQLHADGARLAQALSNVLSNAVKFTAPGGKISLEAKRESDQLTLRITDSGIGMSSEALSSAFDMFVQGDRSPERNRSGLGLGLTLVKRLVEMHDGAVSLHSDGPGRGTAVVIRLPLATAWQCTPVTTALDSTTPSAAAATTGSHRILVVDDNQDAASTLSLLLQLDGHEVECANDGATALEIAAHYRPRLVLLDIGMPGMDGYAVARKVRSAPWGKDMVLIAITGWGLPNDRAQAMAAGFDDHLVKPVDPELIRSLLASITRAIH